MRELVQSPAGISAVLYGSRRSMAVREFITNSGLFWIFDALLVLSTVGVGQYVGEIAHYVLLAACLVQTWVIVRWPVAGWGLANFVAPALYMAVDVVLEGAEFFDQSYHLVLWGYAGVMALAYGLHRGWPSVSAIMQGVGRTALLPALYMVSEEAVWSGGKMTLYAYWFEDSAHLFILLSSLMFGVLLGLSTLLRDRFERLLRAMAAYLEQLAAWVYDPALMVDSFEDASRLALQRVQRTILFMDIRGFTAWSEVHDPADVVHMLNEFYTLTEPIVAQHHGFKLQLIGDEILTRFSTPQDAVRAALALQEPVQRLLDQYMLGAGIGIHTGDVIEGLIGSDTTRQYGIIGDAVNTAARLQGAADSGEVLVSEITWKLLPPAMGLRVVRERMIQAKGKTEPLRVYVVASAGENE